MNTHIFDQRSPSLKEAQDMVGGFVEVVDLPNGMVLLCDEEGLLKGKEINYCATLLARQKIVGDVVLLEGRAKKNWR